MIVVVLSVTPEKLRGELTRWLLEISTGVYIGHLSARVRDRLWDRIVDDVSTGRALMVWSTRNEQRMQFRVHNHSWTVEDFDGISLMRRVTPESREIARAKARQRSAKTGNQSIISAPRSEHDVDAPRKQPKHWSRAGRRRIYRNVVEKRHDNQTGEFTKTVYEGGFDGAQPPSTGKSDEPLDNDN